MLWRFKDRAAEGRQGGLREGAAGDGNWTRAAGSKLFARGDGGTGWQHVVFGGHSETRAARKQWHEDTELLEASRKRETSETAYLPQRLDLGVPAVGVVPLLP